MTKTIVDTDPGTDDALAIMMALVSPALDVQGLTTVGGNATLAHATRNALRLVEYMGRPTVPVSTGSARPLKGRFHYAYHFHGPAGLTVRLPLPRLAPHPTSAPEFISNLVAAHSEKTTVIALGPLTNLARALQRYPELKDHLERIVVMGGAVEVPGNVNEYAEFNIHNDPVAADLVLSFGIPITLIGLDVCTQVYATREDLDWISGGSKRARLARRVLANWFKTHPDRERYDLCDPLAVAAAIDTGLLGYRPATVTVDTDDPEQMGRTIATYGDGPVQVATTVDAPRAKALIADLLSDPS